MGLLIRGIERLFEYPLNRSTDYETRKMLGLLNRSFTNECNSYNYLMCCMISKTI